MVSVASDIRSPLTTPQVAVVLPLPLAGVYDYGRGDAVVRCGDWVEVPWGKRILKGVVWGEGTATLAPERIKPLMAVCDEPPLPEVSRAFIDWVARYTMVPRGAVLKMVLTGQGAKLKRAKRTQIHFSPPDLERPRPQLSSEQATAAQALTAATEAGEFAVFVLDGVTGSGKTEVYFEAIAAAARQGQQSLILLPEIVLSAQWLARFEARFGVTPALWHSGLSPAQRRETWAAVARGEALVVVGARSALFLPYPRLGLVVVDEEHDPSFKQEDGVCYHARDMAVVRGQLGKIPVVLASATPSLESLANVQAGRYRLLHLPERHGGATLPEIVLVDLRRHAPSRGQWLSPPLLTALGETLDRGEQAMLFLNRRGYAPLTLCRACGHRFCCPHCTAWLVEHRRGGRAILLCHHCGHVTARPEQCPECGEEGTLTACGPGVDRIAEEASLRFPKARVAVLASDTVGDAGDVHAVIQRMGAREIDLLVGTQMVAKGHHFPHLTLVGVVDADLGLEGGDLRASERTFQTLSQVAGRAGRAEHPGTVFLQSWQVDHPVMKAMAQGQRDAFVAAEITARQQAGMPPFGRLAAVIVSGPQEAAVDAYVRRLAQAIPVTEGVMVMGPAPAPLAVLRGRHRRRFLVSCARNFPLQSWLGPWLERVPLTGAIRVQLDIDPYSFF